MSISGLVFRINDYGMELDSFLGTIYLPWHTIATAVFITVAYKIYRMKVDKWQSYCVQWWDLVWRISQLTNGVSP